VLEGFTNISRDVDRLNLERAKIENLTSVIIGNENYIDASGGFATGVSEAHFGQRAPSCGAVEEERGGILSDNPVFAKPNRASNDRFVLMVDTAHTQRIFGFVFCAIGDYVVERTETMTPVSFGSVCLVSYQIAENLC